MRTAAVLEPGLLSSAERCAVRLDGDGFDLGLSIVAVDALIGAVERAACLRSAVVRHGLVVDTWTAAWVHGAAPVLPNPLTLAVDRSHGRVLRSMRPVPREVRFGEGEVEVLGGTPVTTPLKTAFDLLLRDGEDAAATASALLRRTGLDPDDAAAAISAMPKHNGKGRVAARARELLLAAPPVHGLDDGGGRDQPAETRYTS